MSVSNSLPPSPPLDGGIASLSLIKREGFTLVVWKRSRRPTQNDIHTHTHNVTQEKRDPNKGLVLTGLVSLSCCLFYFFFSLLVGFVVVLAPAAVAVVVSLWRLSPIYWHIVHLSSADQKYFVWLILSLFWVCDSLNIFNTLIKTSPSQNEDHPSIFDFDCAIKRSIK